MDETMNILKTYSSKIKTGDYKIEVEMGELISEIVIRHLVELIKTDKLNENAVRKVLDSHATSTILVNANWRFEKHIIKWLKTELMKFLNGEENKITEMIEAGRLKCYLFTDYDDITLEEDEKVICSYKMDKEDVKKLNEIVEETIKEVLKLK